MEGKKRAWGKGFPLAPEAFPYLEQNQTSSCSIYVRVVLIIVTLFPARLHLSIIIHMASETGSQAQSTAVRFPHITHCYLTC